jgi:chromosome segregation ATPase
MATPVGSPWSDIITPIIVALIGGSGVLGYVVSLVKQGRLLVRKGEASEQRLARIDETDRSLLVVAKARDELAEDNARLRAERAECDERERLLRLQIDRERAEHEAERQRWRERLLDLERKLAQMQGEIRRLKLTIDPNEGVT